jgi:CubicO group peptidase (beta-lactamase class C family)
MNDAPVRAVMARAVEQGVFPGAAVIVADAGQVIFTHAVGSEQLVPTRRSASIDTAWDLASLTKPLASVTLTMRLVEAGMLDLDAPVRDYLPDFAHHAIRARDLLSHSSGLPAHRRYWEYPDATSRDAILALARREPLEYATGSKSVYSDVGFLVLGSLIEQLGGAPIDVLFQTIVPDGPAYGPVGKAAATELEANGAPLVGIVHDENARAMGGAAPHAGLFGTVQDVHEVLAFLIAGQLVSAATLERFWSPAGVPDSTWCLGWDRPSETGSAAGERFPRSAVGHLGFTGCSIWVDPPRGMWVILLSNRVHPSRDNQQIRAFRPLLHDTVWRALRG